MQDYNWPGNIRELQTSSSVPVIISNEDEIGPDALHLFPVKERPETKSRVLDPVKDLKTAMEELELEYINHAYEKYGNVREATESLGMTPSTFVRKGTEIYERCGLIDGKLNVYLVLRLQM